MFVVGKYVCEVAFGGKQRGLSPGSVNREQRNLRRLAERSNDRRPSQRTLAPDEKSRFSCVERTDETVPLRMAPRCASFSTAAVAALAAATLPGAAAAAATAADADVVFFLFFGATSMSAQDTRSCREPFLTDLTTVTSHSAPVANRSNGDHVSLTVLVAAKPKCPLGRDTTI